MKSSTAAMMMKMSIRCSWLFLTFFQHIYRTADIQIQIQIQIFSLRCIEVFQNSLHTFSNVVEMPLILVNVPNFIFLPKIPKQFQICTLSVHRFTEDLKRSFFTSSLFDETILRNQIFSDDVEI